MLISSRRLELITRGIAVELFNMHEVLAEHRPSVEVSRDFADVLAGMSATLHLVSDLTSNVLPAPEDNE